MLNTFRILSVKSYNCKCEETGVGDNCWLLPGPCKFFLDQNIELVMASSFLRIFLKMFCAITWASRTCN